jgi:uncharacterized membrane protein
MQAEASQAATKIAAQEPSSKPSRLLAVDALRGLIIVFMALDHANYFVAQKHPASEIWDGMFPVYYDTLTFLTRLVTHFAAPGFFLLMGVGMLLFARSRAQRGWSRWAVIRHFWIRGALLMALQLLVVNRAWELSLQGWDAQIYIGVLFALGASMILASLLLWLKPVYVLALTLALFVGTELLHPGLGMWNSVSHSPVSVIHLYPGGDNVLWSFYPIWPWMELVTFGIFFGSWLAQDPRAAFSRAWKLGIAFLLAFVAIRAFDGFGNIRPRMGNSWIDFLNTVKYPPSMAFTLMTTGVNLIVLWLLSQIGPRLQPFVQPLVVFGRSPLLFYVLHLFLYAGIAHLIAPNGTSIPLMLPFWLLGMLILYPLCFLYGRFKQRRPVNSLVHLF